MVQTFFLFPQFPRVCLRTFFLRALDATLLTERGMIYWFCPKSLKGLAGVCVFVFYFFCFHPLGSGLIYLNTKHRFYPLHVCRVNRSCMSNMTLTFLGFFCKDVAFKSMFPFNVSGAGDFESLLGAGVSFHFWHSLRY